ncbi:MAG: helix-turn-helix transcriptional regulator [Actinophytocola sp.]|uniref:helix-turn-helix domain-containing protein n=1 Tax=Actinophytocola sp. TaxID=1872138 RepID=UPI003C780856
MPTRFERQRAEFGARLRQLREDTGLNGKEFAARLRWNTPKLSKIENGHHTISDDDLEHWIATLGLPAPVADELRTTLAELRAQYVTWKEAVRGGHLRRQEDSVAREARAKVIRAVDVGVVPGLIQTADYARAALLAHANLHGGGQDLPEAVRVRMRRQQVLYEGDRTIELLMTESALLHPVAPPDVMAGQVSRLLATIGTPRIRLGILPVGVRLPYMLMHGYWIVDDVVEIELVTAESTVVDPDEVATYTQLTDMLWSAAVEDDAARDLLVATLEQFRANAKMRAAPS